MKRERIKAFLKPCEGSGAWPDLLIWTICITVSVVFASLCSPDSPLTHSGLCHVDTSWFREAGKWMLQGLTPYEDFADSKGPLLWLIFGLIHVTNPDGWLSSCIFFACYQIFVYRYIWKSVKLMLSSDLAAAIVTIAMPIVFFGFAHEENRAEDLCQLPLAYLIYIALSALSGRGVSNTQSWLAGVCLGTMLFVKWNFTLMLLPLALIPAIVMPRSQARSYIIRLFGSIAAIFIAVCVWMWLSGSLIAMFREYFFYTFQTIHDSRTIKSLISDYFYVMSIIMPYRKLTWLIILSVPLVSIKLYKRKGWLLTLAYYWIFLFYFIHYGGYYERIADSFALFIPTALLLYIPILMKVPIWILPIEFVVILNLTYSRIRVHENFGETAQLADYIHLSEMIQSYDKPYIMYYNHYVTGVSINTNALPACKYWAAQMGATPEMRLIQQQTLQNRVADIVITSGRDFEPEKYGYIRYENKTFPPAYPSDPQRQNVFIKAASHKNGGCRESLPGSKYQANDE